MRCDTIGRSLSDCGCPKPECVRCRGSGVVWINLESLPIGPAGKSLLRAATRRRCYDDGRVEHEITCPLCVGK